MTSYYRRLPKPHFHKVAPVSWAENLTDNMVWLWEQKPCIGAYGSANRSVGTSTTVYGRYNTERFNDGYGFYWNDVNNSELVVNADGLYLFTAHVDWKANTTGERKVTIYGDVTGLASDIQKPDTDLGYCTQSLSFVAPIAAGTIIKVGFYQTSGSTLDVNAGSASQEDRYDLSAIFLGSVRY